MQMRFSKYWNAIGPYPIMQMRRELSANGIREDNGIPANDIPVFHFI